MVFELTPELLVLGGVVAGMAAFMGGLTGFGYGLMSAPLLLLMGFPTPLVVMINMLLSASTRVTTAIEFRHIVCFRKVGWLLLGNVPGLALGLGILRISDESTLRRITGIAVILMALLMVFLKSTGKRVRTSVIVGVGVAGGVFGATSSLNGIPPALLYAFERSSPRQLIADLSAYFVVSNSLVLAVLLGGGFGLMRELLVASFLWLPGVLALTYAANRLTGRLPVKFFRILVFGVVLAGGVSAILSS